MVNVWMISFIIVLLLWIYTVYIYGKAKKYLEHKNLWIDFQLWVASQFKKNGKT